MCNKVDLLAQWLINYAEFSFVTHFLTYKLFLVKSSLLTSTSKAVWFDDLKNCLYLPYAF